MSTFGLRKGERQIKLHPVVLRGISKRYRLDLVDVPALVHAADPTGRVELIRHDSRQGLGGNWNRAIVAARGDLVHLLHQDDYVLPGFYARMDEVFRRTPSIGMAPCVGRTPNSPQ
jgi:GT2 family glycosyltransferase